MKRKEKTFWATALDFKLRFEFSEPIKTTSEKFQQYAYDHELQNNEDYKLEVTGVYRPHQGAVVFISESKKEVEIWMCGVRETIRAIRQKVASDLTAQLPSYLADVQVQLIDKKEKEIG